MHVTDFNWEQQSNIWEKWWNKKLGRPIFQIRTPVETNRIKASRCIHDFLPMYDFSIPAEKIIRDMEADITENLCQYQDASYPRMWINFGPGVLAAMIGGTGNCGENTIWFHPGKFEGYDISEITVQLDRNSKWFLRVEEFFIAASKHLAGKIHIGQTDIGGTLDVLSCLRPGEKLIFDMYDQPEEVKRLSREIHKAWFEAYDYFNSLLPESNHGYSAWAGLLSRKPHYMLQCDFAYMISPDQFAEFVLPELSASCKQIARPFYHLDGKGQLPHMEHLLSISELAGIQWVPGAGAPDCSNWPEVYRRITASDRLTQVYVTGDVGIIEKVLAQTERPELMLFTGDIKKGQEERLNKIYHQYEINPI